MPKECCKKAWEKVPESEPVFTVRAQDKLSALIVDLWCQTAEHNGVSPEKVKQGRKHLSDILRWQAENPHKVKLPD